jgi:sialidase-1
MKKNNSHRKYHNKWLVYITIAISLSVISCADKSKSRMKMTEPLIVLKLTPSENNPRNSEGDFINLKDGRILFIYSHFTGSSDNDNAPAILAGRFTNDGGKTWSGKDKVILQNEGGMNIMSVSLLRLQNEAIALFYCRKNSETDCIPLMRISKDEAETWSEPVPVITDKKGYFVLNNNRVIQLADGRLLLAVALHMTPGSKWKNKADLYCYYSDDNGKAWLSGAKVPDTTNEEAVQEPGLISLKDGRIMMYCRASGGFQLISFSSDLGKTWSNLEASNIPSPLSPATIGKIQGTGACHKRNENTPYNCNLKR